MGATMKTVTDFYQKQHHNQHLECAGRNKPSIENVLIGENILQN